MHGQQHIDEWKLVITYKWFYLLFEYVWLGLPISYDGLFNVFRVHLSWTIFLYHPSSMEIITKYGDDRVEVGWFSAVTFK